MTVVDLADRFPAEQITKRARQIHFWATTLRLLIVVLRLLGGLLFGAGWLAYKALAGLWFVGAWVVSAVVLGWVTARGPQLATDD